MQPSLSMSSQTEDLNVEATLAQSTHHPVRLTGHTIRFIAAGGWSEITLVETRWTDAQGQAKDGQFVRKRARQPVAFKHRELEVHRELHHPNIVNVEGWWYEEANSLSPSTDVRHLNLLLTPCCDLTLGDLDLPLDETIGLCYIRQLSAALEYLHSPERSIAHRDIKPENVLVRMLSKGENAEGISLYLCDFGCAKKILPTEQNGVEVGEQRIRAPELLRQRGYGTYSVKIDVFALGLLFVRLLLGTDLLESQTDHSAQLTEFERVFGATQTEGEVEAMLRDAFGNNATPPSIQTIKVMAKALIPESDIRIAAVEFQQEVLAIQDPAKE